MNKLNGRNEEDRRVYERSARLILLLALRDVVPGAKVRFEHSIGHGIYMNVVGADVTASLVRRIEKRMARNRGAGFADYKIPLDARGSGRLL